MTKDLIRYKNNCFNFSFFIFRHRKTTDITVEYLDENLEKRRAYDLYCCKMFSTRI